MLIPFGIVFGTGLLFIFCAWRRRDQPGFGFGHSRSLANPGFHSAVFEQPGRWLVVKGTDPSAVQAALNLRHPTPCSWEEGMLEARENKLFISPSIAGWVLVMGSSLPTPFEDVDEFFHFMTDLSRKLGQVQFFSASRVLSQHAWILMERGRVFRAYAWAGETLWNQGAPTAAERELNLRCFEYGAETNPYAAKDELAANSDRVCHLAARWSIDPAALCSGSWTGHGILGGVSSFKSH